MFNIEQRKAKRLGGLVKDVDVEYQKELKLFKITFTKVSLSPEAFKTIRRLNLEVDEVVNYEDGKVSILLKNKSAKNKIIIGVLFTKVWLLALALFLLVISTPPV